ncbi:hypothetical protein HJFPF1_13159 [Paramyrothecium foliicola]|nr:hypothetical protein HJFPF1_13159 [Paramyrothecium foliicola]
MSSSENKHSDDVPPGDINIPPEVPPSTLRPTQRWTVDGYPIVDGKFLDLATDEIKTHTGLASGGPPSLSVYWHNCGSVRHTDHFFALGCMSMFTVTEYLVRVGEMLSQEKCTISSLNATRFAINIIVKTDLSSIEFKELLRQYHLIASASWS